MSLVINELNEKFAGMLAKKQRNSLFKSILNEAKDDGKRQKEIVDEVTKDFEKRREARRTVEAEWLLNINFMLGNQYAYLSPIGELSDQDKRYNWQERNVFNHIAPIIEGRLAKFTRVNTKVNVRPASSDDKDVDASKLATKIIESTELDNNFIGLTSIANYWSEVTGTAFYKIEWDKNQTKNGNDGGVVLSVCPPYEIYPDCMSNQSLDDCISIIHAKAYPVSVVEDMFSVHLTGGDVSVINMDYKEKGVAKIDGEVRSNHVIVIEKYEKPSNKYENGRLLIVAGDKLLYEGDLPYKNGIDGNRIFPFVMQKAFSKPQSFFGISLIERLIPVQRAYNAVKNRKNEFINRLSAGVFAVEDGSVDVELLEEEGLSPGKIIVYRQGSTPPKLMTSGTIPSELKDEEDRLLAEFTNISGASDFASSSIVGNVSGYALSLLLEQDYSRLSVSTESIRNAIRGLSRQILMLYRQFGKTSRIAKISGDNGEILTVSFLGSELKGDDIVMEADSDLVETPAVRKSKVEELLKLGLFSDEDGKMSNLQKSKVLEMLGFGNFETGRDLDEVHITKSKKENIDMQNEKEVNIEDVDDHDIHVEEHSRFLVSGRDTLSDRAKEIINLHIRRHKVIKDVILRAETSNKGE